MRKCETSGTVTRCVYLGWPDNFYAYARGNTRRTFWHGSVIEDKKDGAGTFYRRNRHYDAQSGRFTQEDPIGLAGGLNVYGFANGDPVNYSDPFGLCPIEKTGIPCKAEYAPGITVSSAKLRGFLDNFAAEQNRPVYVYSGDRDPGKNAKVGGAKGSYHTRGQAADVIFKGGTKKETVQALFDSEVRASAGVRLLYHGPGATLPEHSHVDLGAGPDLLEQKKGQSPRYVPLKREHIFP